MAAVAIHPPPRAAPADAANDRRDLGCSRWAHRICAHPNANIMHRGAAVMTTTSPGVLLLWQDQGNPKARRYGIADWQWQQYRQQLIGAGYSPRVQFIPRNEVET
jgi:hypothetical protein